MLNKLIIIFAFVANFVDHLRQQAPSQQQSFADALRQVNDAQFGLHMGRRVRSSFEQEHMNHRMNRRARSSFEQEPMNARMTDVRISNASKVEGVCFVPVLMQGQLDFEVPAKVEAPSSEGSQSAPSEVFEPESPSGSAYRKRHTAGSQGSLSSGGSRDHHRSSKESLKDDPSQCQKPPGGKPLSPITKVATAASGARSRTGDSRQKERSPSVRSKPETPRPSQSKAKEMFSPLIQPAPLEPMSLPRTKRADRIQPRNQTG